MLKLGFTNFMIWMDFAHEGIEYDEYEKVVSHCRIWKAGDRAVSAQHFLDRSQ